MTELANTYLGNSCHHASLSNRVEQAKRNNSCLEVHLSQTDSHKGRIYVRSTSGKSVGIIKGRDCSLAEGDVFETESGQLLLVHLKPQKLIVLSFDQIPGYEIELVHLGHVLGNHHWPIIVQDRKIYIQSLADAELIESTIRNFRLPHLCISYESRVGENQLSFSQHSHHHE